MARKKPALNAKETLDTILKNLVSEYGQQKDRLDALDKIVKDINKEIKKFMSENSIEECTSDDGYAVKYIVSERETINELRLIEILTTKHAELTETFGLVKMKPYVDFDAIEKETYAGNISTDVLKDIGDCKETKEVVSIRLSKPKEK